MKTQELNEARVNVIIEEFTDYVENYYDEDNEPNDVSSIVNDHFEEFTDWAFDDFVINEGERDTLLNNNERELHEIIKREVASEFRIALNNR
ncbi:MAG: hypothetical protein KAR19_12550 [Bacteroidales bacterium]|nr:hypothetical protein [Bacteroidales bacterium]